MKGKNSRKSTAVQAPPCKKHKPISHFFLQQGLLEDSGSCSPSHVDQPTPAAGGPDSTSRQHSAAQPAEGRQVATSMLKSLQRRFVQQTLQTPFAGAAALGGFGGATPHGRERAADDDFVLHSSQTYERGLSQLACDPGQDGSDMQDALTQTQFQLEPTLPRGGLEQLQHRLPQPQAAQPSMSSGGQGQVEQLVPRRTSDASTCSNRATPCGYIQEEEEASCSGVPKLFPVFRRREDYKVLHLIRHGESEYNAATNGPGWEDPEIFDAPLTVRGKQQAASLRQQLAAMNLPPDVLWVTSPLSRAIQTLLFACPALHGNGGPLPNIIVRSEISEKMATTGDVGHPASVLAGRFPMLKEQLAVLPEVWWHCDPSKPNCALERKFTSRENKQQLQRRISDFKKWVQSRPERVIVAVGHSCYWKEFMRGLLGEAGYMRNCELTTVRL